MVSKVGTTGGAAVPVFAISTVGGTPKMALRGDMLIDGVIFARHLSVGSVTADKIAARAITADKINVASLSALNANLGTVTAGLIRDTALTFFKDLTNGKDGRYDGQMTVDYKNKIFEMIF
jgi:hypothetical protein